MVEVEATETSGMLTTQTSCQVRCQVIHFHNERRMTESKVKAMLAQLRLGAGEGQVTSTSEVKLETWT